jgi:renalase
VKAIVVGAGLSGLMAGRQLAAAGHDVTLFDKGRSPGGRLATRRIGDARVDHGAQFFTVRSERFASFVDEWQRDGLVQEWCRGFVDVDGPGSGDGHPRYVVRGGMNALAKHLAQGLDVRCAALVFSLHRSPDGRWEVKLDDGSVHEADALVVTCPLPQTFSLLVSAEVQMPEALWRTDYDRTLSLLAVLDRPSAVPPPGGVQTDPSFTFVGDNHAKGISAIPALTFHAEPGWSDAHWDDPVDDAGAALLELARPWIGDAKVVAHQVKRWRFATPRSIWPEPYWSPDDGARLAVAGDAFAGPRVEGAALSGLAAATALG